MFTQAIFKEINKDNQESFSIGTLNPIVQTDLVHFVKQRVLANEPVATAEGVELVFRSSAPIQAVFQPAILACNLSGLLARLITYTPEHRQIKVSVEANSKQFCTLSITNTGLNLARNNEILGSIHLPFRIVPSHNNETRYQLDVELVMEEQKITPEFEELDMQMMSGFFAAIRERLQSHYSKADQLVSSLSRHSPQEAVFLTKINELIVSNMENNQFDANHLCEAMHMSRTQLFRRLKPIIRQSPGSYIRSLKLQKSKELLETTNMLICEVAYKSGFDTSSHFTKAFSKRYGVKPSYFSKNYRNVNKEMLYPPQTSIGTFPKV